MANRDKEYEAARGRSAASGIMSATSRKSTQVAPSQDEASRITPVEQRPIDSPTPTTTTSKEERPRSNFWPSLLISPIFLPLVLVAL